jgi:hypothetical protein
MISATVKTPTSTARGYQVARRPAPWRPATAPGASFEESRPQAQAAAWPAAYPQRARWELRISEEPLLRAVLAGECGFRHRPKPSGSAAAIMYLPLRQAQLQAEQASFLAKRTQARPGAARYGSVSLASL